MSNNVEPKPILHLRIEEERWNQLSWRGKFALYVLAFIIPIEVFELEIK